MAKQVMWGMEAETKAGFDELANQYGFSQKQFAVIVLAIMRQVLAKNPKIELSPGDNGNGPKVIISEPAA